MLPNPGVAPRGTADGFRSPLEPAHTGRARNAFLGTGPPNRWNLTFCVLKTWPEAWTPGEAQGGAGTQGHQPGVRGLQLPAPTPRRGANHRGPVI